MAVRAHAALGSDDGASRGTWLHLKLIIPIQTVQGLVHNYGGLLGMRWMLGVFEAGLFPGVNYYLSWYVHIHCAVGPNIHRSNIQLVQTYGVCRWLCLDD